MLDDVSPRSPKKKKNTDFSSQKCDLRWRNEAKLVEVVSRQIAQNGASGDIQKKKKWSKPAKHEVHFKIL